MQRATVHYSGHVQGVGFRYTTNSIAREFDVTGYVRNLPDRRVELVAEGEPAEVSAFLAAVREQFSGQIRDEQIDKAAASGEFSKFELRR
ncbi:MAG: acylphosphatase [Pirellulales bacterium]